MCIRDSHSSATGAASTDWKQIVILYDLLFQANPSPVIELNRAVAVAMYEGPAAGLALVDGILNRGELQSYYLAHSARADLCNRLNKTKDAADSYRTALSLAQQEPAQQFLLRRLRKLES